ncbi:VOC family protein [Candidatus Poriferisodalis sp.]|uniref:VOC family protein n=1 Tax=Candidatus Poriferisodalis sp. TaxID=3101277 RepID=UPI003D0F6C6D
MSVSSGQPAWAVTHLRHIAVRCSAFDECVDYYAGPWGLQRLGDSDAHNAVLRATGAEHHVLELHRADRNGIDHISFGLADNRAVDAAASVLAGRGVTLLSEPAALDRPGEGYGFRIADPEGRVVELAACLEAVSALPADATPTKIAHVVLNTADIEALCQWWCELLGFRVSDWSERQMVFLRCNADHHSIAFNRAEWASLNHVAYEVSSLDAYMTSLGRLTRAGHTVGWGPGRHGPGNNAFGYFVDPAGTVPEVTAEVQQVDEATWVPRAWPRTPELSDRWGTAGPPSAKMRQQMAGTPE